MKLSKRLDAVASMVTKGNRVADVGTDHGYVPIYLVKNHIAPYAIAMDVNSGPLERAKEHIREENLENEIITVQSDGMKELTENQVDTVVIAGMGGELICKIINESAESQILDTIKELVVSPHSEVRQVRYLLMEKGFIIVDEMMVEDNGKYYNIIKANRGKEENRYSELELSYGRVLLESKSEIFHSYLVKQKDKYNNIINLLDSVECSSHQKNSAEDAEHPLHSNHSAECAESSLDSDNSIQCSDGISKRNYELRELAKECERAIAIVEK